MIKKCMFVLVVIVAASSAAWAWLELLRCRGKWAEDRYVVDAVAQLDSIDIIKNNIQHSLELCVMYDEISTTWYDYSSHTLHATKIYASLSSFAKSDGVKRRYVFLQDINRKCFSTGTSSTIAWGAASLAPGVAKNPLPSGKFYYSGESAYLLISGLRDPIVVRIGLDSGHDIVLCSCEANEWVVNNKDLVLSSVKFNDIHWNAWLASMYHPSLIQEDRGFVADEAIEHLSSLVTR